MKADVKPQSKTDKLLAIIEGLGLDKFMTPISIRIPELAKLSGIDPNHISGLLATAVTKGRIVMCKITVPGKAKAMNEYRKAAGTSATEWIPLKTNRPGVALRTSPRSNRPAAPLSTPKPGVNDIEPATLGKPQRAVGSPTPAAGDQGLPLVAPAVTAAKATPAPAARVALKKEPTARKVPAGDAIQLQIDDDGTVLISTDEGVIELAPPQSRKLGHFMRATHDVWNPF